MKALPALLALAAVATMAAPHGRADPAPLAGVPNPAQARIDYIMKCQGCHRPDGSGNAVNTPPLTGEVARYLQVEGGREFLGRVPGVATVDLGDARLAQLLNWTLHRYDPGHIPAGFKPYTASEIAALRQQPLRLERLATRETLAARLNQHREKTEN
jgi:mono/diheme cytochrome c family protein